jgi:uncharacterized protein YjbI with pentapeptide repeats
MTPSQNRNFANQRLLDAIFSKEDLTGADFSGSDIRGCIFSKTKLAEANFERVVSGRTPLKLVLYISIGLVLTLSGIGAAVNIVFSSSIGNIAYIIAFIIGIVGYAAFILTATTSANYSSDYSDGERASIFDRIYDAVVWFIILPLIFIAAFAVICSFGVFVFAGTASVTVSAWKAFSRGATVEGFFLALVALMGWIWIPLSGSVGLTTDIIKNMSATNFPGADLTGANFSHATLRNTVFTGSITDHVNWTGATFKRCTFSGKLADLRIRKLCSSRNGRDNNYSNLDLQQLHLISVIPIQREAA